MRLVKGQCRPQEARLTQPQCMREPIHPSKHPSWRRQTLTEYSDALAALVSGNFCGGSCVCLARVCQAGRHEHALDAVVTKHVPAELQVLPSSKLPPQHPAAAVIPAGRRVKALQGRTSGDSQTAEMCRAVCLSAAHTGWAGARPRKEGNEVLHLAA